MKYNSSKLPDSSVNVPKSNMFLYTLKLLISISIIFILFYVALLFSLNFIVEHISYKQEQKLASMLSFEGVEDDIIKDNYLQEITDKLLLCANLDYPIKTYIVEQKELNAFALPGGKIYITRGMLKLLKNENELATIIGHEIGHFKHKDHLKGFGNSLILGILSSFFGNDYGKLFQTSLVLSNAKFSQSAEYNADVFAIDLMACGYQNVSNTTTLFERMDDSKKWKYFLESHPSFGSRIDRMKERIVHKNYPQNNKIIPLKEKF